MHSTLRLLGVLILGILLGGIVAIPTAIFLLRTPLGQTYVRSYLVPQQEQDWPDVTSLVEKSGGSVTANATTTVDKFLSGNLKILVPRTNATIEYAEAINGVFMDMQGIASTTKELGPVLVQMNSQSLSGNFSGFFNLVVTAKTLVSEQRKISTQLSQHLSALSSANQQTPDAVTKSLTQTLVSAGQPLPGALNEYLDTLDELLSGNVPSAATITAVGTKAGVFSDALANFNSNFQKILLHFGATVGIPTQ